MACTCKSEISVSELKEGDLIEFKRKWGTYSHWGVYVGNRKVSHYAPDPDATGKLNLKDTKRGTSIRKEDIKTVAGRSKAYRNNKLDEEFKPLSKRKIVRRAEKKLNSKGYNAMFYNCEHFATWCRYGRAISEQVQALVHGAATLITGAWLYIRQLQRPAVYMSSWNRYIEWISRKMFDKICQPKPVERVKL